MAIHSEALATHHTPRSEPIYYCATGIEMPSVLCKEKRDQRISDGRLPSISYGRRGASVNAFTAKRQPQAFLTRRVDMLAIPLV
jgi:hypothetical protein